MTEALPTVAVPGLLCSPRVYDAQLPLWWQFGQVTVADHTRDESIATVAQRLLANAPPEFALVGISMGGYVAMEVVRQAPERVRKLALLCTSARPDAPEQTQRRQRQIELAEQGGFEQVKADFAPLMFKRKDDPALLALVHAMADETGPEAFVRQQRSIMGRIDSRASLEDVRCPTLVLAAEHDALMPQEVAIEMARAVPGARLEVIADAGHLPTLEQPQAVNEVLATFWRV